MHPTLLDKIRVRFWKNYLYLGQEAWNESKVYAGILHKTPDAKESWRVMDYQYFLRDSRFKYLGTAKQFHLLGEVNPNSSVFEVITPIIETSVIKPTHISKGDYICLAPSDRKYIYPVRL